MGVGNVPAVYRFEWKRAKTVPRMAWWGVLALFPAFIVVLVRVTAYEPPPREIWSVFLFMLVPMLISMLGTFLWTAPAVSAELERRSWVYLAVRPDGPTAVILGKYLAAVSWALSAALIGLTLAVLIAKTGEGWSIWISLAGLVCLSCPAYAAMYLVVGTLFPKRAMVISVMYTLVFELVVSFIPAMINKLTVQYRLRALLFEWTDFHIDREQFRSMSALVGDSPAWVHVSILLAYTFTLLAIAVALVRWCEFTATQESDV